MREEVRRALMRVNACILGDGAEISERADLYLLGKGLWAVSGML